MCSNHSSSSSSSPPCLLQGLLQTQQLLLLLLLLLLLRCKYSHKHNRSSLHRRQHQQLICLRCNNSSSRSRPAVISLLPILRNSHSHSHSHSLHQHPHQQYRHQQQKLICLQILVRSLPCHKYKQYHQCNKSLPCHQYNQYRSSNNRSLVVPVPPSTPTPRPLIITQQQQQQRYPRSTMHLQGWVWTRELPAEQRSQHCPSQQQHHRRRKM
mmetsp:Transcript_26947/g.41777  ORF Transcript_26947/g.41777 Transcript_26947/m.41777 type:complete len:211 (-) Transcript_26947:1660-2292(-)